MFRVIPTARKSPQGGKYTNLITFNISQWRAWAPGLESAADWQAWSAAPCVPEAGEQALLDVAGRAYTAVDASGRVYGQVDKGGSIIIGGEIDPKRATATAADAFLIVREGARLRLRPIAMTVMSTLLGVLPLVLTSGPGAEAREAIAWVVLGGLGLSTLFTLYLAPMGYTFVAPFMKPRAHASEELDAEINAYEASLNKRREES